MTKKYIVLTILVFVSGLLLIGCSSSTETQATDAEPTEPDVSAETFDALIEGRHRFAFALFHTLPDEQNSVFSPYSISNVFSMVYAGAGDETANEMRNVFGFLPQEQQHPAHQLLSQRLNRQPTSSDEQTAAELNLAARLWIQDDFSVQQPFLDVLTIHYGASPQKVDFANSPNEAGQQINDWVATETNNRINDIVSPSDISTSTRVVLADAVYYKGQWEYPFSKSSTEPAPFTTLDGQTVSVDMMPLATRLNYAEGPNYQAVRLPYVGSSIEMLVLLPTDGDFVEVKQELDANYLADMDFNRADMDFRMPKWDFETSLNLIDILRAMGLESLFSRTPHLDNIAPGLSIDFAKHKANITVDERGSEAAASTVVGMDLEGPEEIVTMIVNRPFIFLLQDTRTKEILFIGQVVDPSSE